MKRTVIYAAGAILCVVLVFLLCTYWARRKEDPEILLSWLNKSKGDREEILMRLNMARGDVVGPMTRAFKNPENSPRFRGDVLELLFKKNLRTPDPLAESTFVAALKDPSPLIRKRAVDDFRIFGDFKLKPLLAPFIKDPDPAVRNVVYRIFTEDVELWDKLKPEERNSLVRNALAMRGQETDSTLMILNRTLIGREIGKLCHEGLIAFLSSDVVRGDSLFKLTSSLDTGNYRPALTLGYYYAGNGDKKTAEKIARAAGTLMEIPRLPSAPKIDGDPTDAVWSRGLFLDRVTAGNVWAVKPTDSKCKLHIGHLNGTLYLTLIAYESDVSKLKITQTKRDAKNFMDDCVEMIFSPKNDRSRYFKFIINAGGSIYDRFSSNPAANFVSTSAVKIFKDRGYWALEFAVAAKDLDNNTLRSGDLWNIGLVWCRQGVKLDRAYFWYSFDEDLIPLALFK